MICGSNPAGDSRSCLKGQAHCYCEDKFESCCFIDLCSLQLCPGSTRASRAVADDIDGKSTTASVSFEEKSDDTQGHDVPGILMDNQPKPTIPTIKTDSGVTHTIPNSSIVIITRHTTVTTGRNLATTLSSTDSISFNSQSTTVVGFVESRATTTPSSVDSAGVSAGDINISHISSGAIVGIGVGGTVLFFITAVIAYIFLRQKRRKDQDSIVINHDGRNNLEEQRCPQSTGSQGSSDPFAPFGGRADQPEDPYKPATNTFELDGTSTAPFELPSISVVRPRTLTSKFNHINAVEEVVSTDTRASPEFGRMFGDQSTNINQ